jgi:alpha-tubulin suppressor-like RCC1 family protein
MQYSTNLYSHGYQRLRTYFSTQWNSLHINQLNSTVGLLNLGIKTKKIKKIVCNNDVIHSISEHGQVYSWGNDRDKTGLLGLGLNYNQNTPVLNTNFSNKKIIDISLSEKHAAALDSIIN